jgi:hypothetical protein
MSKNGLTTTTAGFLHEDNMPRLNTNDYRLAEKGEGPLVGPWAVKRNLVHDLCVEVDRLQDANDVLLAALERLLENYKRNKGKGLGIGPIAIAKSAIRIAKG